MRRTPAQKLTSYRTNPRLSCQSPHLKSLRLERDVKVQSEVVIFRHNLQPSIRPLHLARLDPGELIVHLLRHRPSLPLVELRLLTLDGDGPDGHDDHRGAAAEALIRLEHLVAASLQVERRESDGEAEDDTCARSTATKAHAAVGAADGEGSVRGAQAFADHASLLAGMQLQQQLAQLAAAAYPAFQGVPASSVPRGFPTAEVVPARKAPPPEASLAPAMGVSAAMDPALVAGNSFVAALQAQLAVSHAASKVTTLWDPLQAVQYASLRAPSPADLATAARAILAAQTAAQR